MDPVPQVPPNTEPSPKRRKIDFIMSPSPITAHHAEIRPDGTMTPVHDPPSAGSDPNAGPMNDGMDLSMSPSDCPCGYLHGPGDHHFHDISAVGLSASMMRGPD